MDHFPKQVTVPRTLFSNHGQSDLMQVTDDLDGHSGREMKVLTCAKVCSSVRVPDDFEATIYCSFCGGEMEKDY
jgi:hypothetical protein